MILKMFAKRFYARNLGFFLFLFIMMFGIIETSSGDKQVILSYHYRLILGMLSNDAAFFILLFAWLLYACRCFNFISGVVSAADASFLYIVNNLEKKTVFNLFLGLCALLYLPVIAYSVAVAWIAFDQHQPVKFLVIILFQVFVCVYGATYFQKKIRFAGAARFILRAPAWLRNFSNPYFSFLLSGIFRTAAPLFTGIKIFSCLVLCMFLRNLNESDYDFRFMMMFFLMANLGHAIIIHRTRYTEETRLTFYRQLPFTRGQRWIQYVLYYSILLVPELLTLSYFIPAPLHPADGAEIFLFAWSFLLFQHAVLSVSLLPAKKFLKIMLSVFMVQFLFIADGAILPLIILQGVSATALFMGSYYLFELKNGIPGERQNDKMRSQGP